MGLFFRVCVGGEGAHLFSYFMNEKLSGLPNITFHSVGSLTGSKLQVFQILLQGFF